MIQRANAILPRLALHKDIDAVAELADSAVRAHLGPLLGEARIAEVDDFNHLDPWLIEDRTYYIVEIEGKVAGSGGWSRRAGLIRGPNPAESDNAPLDPTRDAARIRAMYTHPHHARRGIGRAILGLSEAAARAAGFRRAELIASLSGEPLYLACGWRITERSQILTRSGLAIPVAKMEKSL